MNSKNILVIIENRNKLYILMGVSGYNFLISKKETKNIIKNIKLCTNNFIISLKTKYRLPSEKTILNAIIATK